MTRRRASGSEPRRALIRQAVGGVAALALPGSALPGSALPGSALPTDRPPAGAPPGPSTRTTPVASPPSPPSRPLVATATAAAAPLSFGFIGDTPYGRQEEPALRRVLGAMPVDELAFALHVGDIKARGESCDNALLEHRLGLLDSAPLPLIYTPGDNEWTDCRLPPDRPLALRRASASSDGTRGENRRRANADGDTGDADPDSAAAWRAPLGPGGRLRWLREHAFAADQSLGRRRLAIERQGRHDADARAVEPRLPENVRWQMAGLQFCTVHVIGSDNGLDGVPIRGSRTGFERLAYDDWVRREQANLSWLVETVDEAEQAHAAGLVIALHANLRFAAGADDGFARTRLLIARLAQRFDGPVLLLHGDTHLFRIGHPLAAQGLNRLLMVECYGSPFVSSWIRIDWDPARIDSPDGPFRVRAHPT